VSPWERLKIGAGTPPIMTRHGWLILYHGVSEIPQPNDSEHHLRYSAGVMVLSKEHPQAIRYRSAEPVLTPELPEECHGTVAHVVFPTGIDRRDDLGAQIASTSTTGWPTTGLAQLASTFRTSYRRRQSPTRRE